MKSSSLPLEEPTRVLRSPISGKLLWGLFLVGLAWPAVADPFEVAVLQGMDKVTARVSTIEAPVGEVVKFGALEIIARTCDLSLIHISEPTSPY